MQCSKVLELMDKDIQKKSIPGLFKRYPVHIATFDDDGHDDGGGGRWWWSRQGWWRVLMCWCRLRAENTTSHFDITSLLVSFASDTSQKEDIILRALDMTRQELKHVRVAGLELVASLCEPKDTRLNELMWAKKERDVTDWLLWLPCRSQTSRDDDYAVRAIAFRLNHQKCLWIKLKQSVKLARDAWICFQYCSISR